MTVPSKHPPPAKAIIPYMFLTMAQLCWAGNIVLARGVSQLIPPGSFAFWRWTLALAILLPFALRHLKRQWAEVAQAWKVLLLLSLLGISAFSTLLYTAVQTTTAINGALIYSSMPAVIILINRLVFRQKCTSSHWIGVLLSGAGAALIVIRGRLAAVTQIEITAGDLLMIAAVLMYSSYSVLLRKRPAIHPLTFLATTFAMGAFGLGPLFVWELYSIGATGFDWRVTGSIIYVAVFPSIVAYFCWNRGVELIGANRAGLFINLIPLFASVLAILFLGESIEWFHFGGATMIFCGMLLFQGKDLSIFRSWVCRVGWIWRR